MSLSIDLLPLHPAYLMLAWLIIVAPWGWESGGCQQGFARLRWIFIVFVPWSVRATVTGVETGWFQEAKNGFGLHWDHMCPHGCILYMPYDTGFSVYKFIFSSDFNSQWHSILFRSIRKFVKRKWNSQIQFTFSWQASLTLWYVLFPDSTEEARIQVETGRGKEF